MEVFHPKEELSESYSLIFETKVFFGHPNQHSGVARGGQMGARTLGRRPWGRTSTLFAVI